MHQPKFDAAGSTPTARDSDPAAEKNNRSGSASAHKWVGPDNAAGHGRDHFSDAHR